MVVPQPILDAATAGNVAAVREWIESGGDPNDTSSDGHKTLLTRVVVVLGYPRSISEAHLDLVRLLVSHGADVTGSYPTAPALIFTPVHICTMFPDKDRCGCLLQLLLDAGAHVNRNSHGATPLGLALAHSIWHVPDESRKCLDIVTQLLRANATLDAIEADNVSAETLLCSVEERIVQQREEAGIAASELPYMEFYACKALISDYRAAGSNWRSYMRAPLKELLRLRSLVAHRRARGEKRLRAKTPREVALLFASTLPNELFWNIATYWNPRY